VYGTVFNKFWETSSKKGRIMREEESKTSPSTARPTINYVHRAATEDEIGNKLWLRK
jgi:hypothetical protein